MPTISQLPVASSISAADEVPISQDGAARAISVGALLSSAQPVITVDSQSLLGRKSLGSGAPEQIDVGTGLSLSGGTLAADGLDHAAFPMASNFQVQSQLVISNQGTPMLMQASMLRGLFSAGQNVVIDPNGIISATGTSTGVATIVSASSIGALQVLTQLSSQDLVPVSHAGSDFAISYGNFLNGITIAQAQTTGAAGATGPQGPAGATGATGAAGSSTSITTAPTVTTMAGTDLVGISEGGSDHSITLANLLGGQTIDAGTAAAPAADANTFWVGQGSSTMLVQSFSALWTWIAGKLPLYHRPVVELTTNTLLDSTDHNTALLICSQPITISPAFSTMGSGFVCDVLNQSSGNVTFASGITTNNGTQTLGAGQRASLSAYTYSGGNVVFAQIGTATAPVVAPGQVTGLTVGITTPSSIALTWQIPSAGGAPSGYTVNYRVTSVGGAWTSQSATGTSLAVSPLSASTQYDFEIIANNSAGSGTASSIVTGTTLAAPVAVPGQVTGLAAGGPTSSTVNLTWAAPSTGGAVASYTAQYRITGGTGFTVAASGITAPSTTVTGLTSATGYDFQVFAVNSVGNGAPSAIATATTVLVTPGLPTALTVGTATSATIPLSWTAPTAGGAVASYSVRSSLSGAGSWTTVTGITGTSTTISSLNASTAYDFEVQSVNASGNSGWTTIVTGSTAAAATNYALGSGYQPYGTATTYSHSSSPITTNVCTLVDSVDGSHTAPTAVYFGWNTSSTVAPTSTSGMTLFGGTFSNGGHTYAYSFSVPVPSTAGTYYFWSVATNAGGAIVATCVQTNSIVSGGSPVAFTIT